MPSLLQVSFSVPSGRRVCGKIGHWESVQVVIAGHAFLQNVRRGHYDLELDSPPATRLAAVFTELARAI